MARARRKPDTVAVLIPARGGSKAIPGKNIRLMAGRPLIHWVLDAATASPMVSAVFVSTDDPAIRRVVENYGSGVQVISRSAESATDWAPTELALMEFASSTDWDHICLVQATSPLLRHSDLTAGIQKYLSGGYDSLLSVVRQRRFIWNNSEYSAQPINYDPRSRPRRQEFSGFLVENGAFYISRRTAILQSGCRLSGRIGVYEMSVDSYLELDEPSDWELVEVLLTRQRRAVVREKLEKIRALAMDVDGVLTDAGMYYGSEGEVLKKFNTRDGMGIRLLMEAGIVPVIITAENTEIVARRARKLRINLVFQGATRKDRVLREVASQLGIGLENIAYIGDDLNDLDALSLAGFSAAPRNAHPEIKKRVHYVCQAAGGEGCVREVCEMILARRKAATGVPNR